MGAAQMTRIAAWVTDLLTHPADDAVRDRVRDEVRGLCREFPIYRPTF
jgi:glycine hydroxymethyltransferase